MPRRRSAQQLAQYDRDGVLFPIPVLTPAEAAMFRGALEAFETQHLGTPFKRADHLHLFFDWAYRLVTHDAIVDVVQDLLGPDISIDGTLVFRKPPHDTSLSRGIRTVSTRVGTRRHPRPRGSHSAPAIRATVVCA